MIILQSRSIDLARRFALLAVRLDYIMKARSDRSKDDEGYGRDYAKRIDLGTDQRGRSSSFEQPRSDRTDLSEIDLNGADLSAANLHSVYLNIDVLADAILTGATLPDGSRHG